MGVTQQTLPPHTHTQLLPVQADRGEQAADAWDGGRTLAGSILRRAYNSVAPCPLSPLPKASPSCRFWRVWNMHVAASRVSRAGQQRGEYTGNPQGSGRGGEENQQAATRTGWDRAGWGYVLSSAPIFLPHQPLGTPCVSSLLLLCSVLDTRPASSLMPHLISPMTSSCPPSLKGHAPQFENLCVMKDMFINDCASSWDCTPQDWFVVLEITMCNTFLTLQIIRILWSN